MVLLSPVSRRIFVNRRILVDKINYYQNRKTEHLVINPLQFIYIYISIQIFLHFRYFIYIFILLFLRDRFPFFTWWLNLSFSSFFLFYLENKKNR